MLLSIIIVNYNVKYFVEQCLDSIFKSKGIFLNEIEIFVVDNNSKDGSITYLKKQFPSIDFPHVYIISNKCNVGFGRANNQAFEKAKGKYILFLNPDTLLTENTLNDTLSLAESRPNIGAIGVKMIHTNGDFALESRRGLPTPWVSFCKMIGLATLLPQSKTFGKYYMQYLSSREINDIDIVSGAFMMIPHTALNKIGTFDENFFMYGEDIDLSYRLIKNGYHNLYCPTTILHYKGESTKKNTYRYVHVFYEAMLIFFKKHYKHYNLFFTLPIKIAIILRATLALILQQTHNLRRFLFPHHIVDKQRMLYIGSSSDLIKQLAEEYGLNMDYYNGNEESLEEGHLKEELTNKRYLHIVYDVSDYRYSTILKIFEQQKNHDIHIGTFNPQKGILITGGQVYTKG